MPNTQRLVVFLSTLLAATVQASVITVDDDGPADFSSIQAAVDAAVDGDVVLVSPGVYRGDAAAEQVVDLLGKILTLRAADGPGTAIIDGENLRRGLRCVDEAGPGIVIEGFTITNCRRAGGSGGLVSNASPTIRDCVFIANRGQGLRILESDLVLEGCTFEDNNSAYGSGIEVTNSDPVIENCRFVDNNSAVHGGGAALVGCGGRIVASVFETNRTGSESQGIGLGGGVYLESSTTSVVDCVFSGNDAWLEGGGLYAKAIIDPIEIVVDGCDFEGNQSGAGAAAYLEGGVAVSVVGCDFTGNTTTYAVPASVLSVSAGTDALVDSCVFDSNQSTFFSIAAVVSGVNSRIEDCRFEANQGGVAIRASPDGHGVVERCSFLGNRGVGYATGVQAYGTGPIRVDDCEFIANVTTPVWCQSTDLTVTAGRFSGHDAPLFRNLDVDSRIVYRDNVFCENSGGLGDGEDQGNCVVDACDDADGDGVPDACGPASCPSDLDGDGSTGGSDLGLLFVGWGVCVDCAADLDGDGRVGGEDLGLMLLGWGPCG